MGRDALADLRERVDAIHARYDAHFAGQPRISRDGGLLARMIDELEAVVGAAAALPASAEREALLGAARDNLALYRREHSAIVEAQAGGEDAFEADRLATWARFAFHRYRRHFAGQPRATRDLGLLAELIADLRRLGEEMERLGQRYARPPLPEMREQVARSLKLYLDERGEIVAARGAGAPDQQADVLAAVANDQFALYAAHFAGKSRVTRRPALLQRIIDNLDQVRDRMELLRAQGYRDAAHVRNIEIVSARLDFYRGELTQIREARRQTTMGELVSALGGAANELFAEYRAHFAGQDRRTRDLARLGRICDGLHEVARQMDEIDRVREIDTNVTNLGIVIDNLRLYEREWEHIREVQAGGKP